MMYPVLSIRPEERGAALLTVLLLVAVIAVIAATSIDRLLLSTRLTGNAGAMAQADAFLRSAEDVALSQAATMAAAGAAEQEDMPGNPAQAQLGETRTIPIDNGSIALTMEDGGNCFNLNALVEPMPSGVLVVDRAAVQTFANLLQLIGFDANRAKRIAASSTDWVDSDDAPMPGGAEDGTYRGLPPGYLPANALMAHPSELKAVNGVEPADWQRIEPYVCALPEPGLSTINVNTLRADQAVLLSMFDPDALTPAAAKSLLANRPAGGYGNAGHFWAQPQLAGLSDNSDAVEQISVNSRYFLMEARVDYGGITAGERAFIDASQGRVHLLWRQELID